MTYVTLYSFYSSYLSLRKAIVNTEKSISTAQKYDKPCCNYETLQTKGLFLLWCMENAQCYNEDIDKFISVVNRFARNCGDCSVSQAEIDAFKITAFAKEMAYKNQLGGYILTQNGVWLLQQNGYQIIL
jgi:hypothetical protein